MASLGALCRQVLRPTVDRQVSMMDDGQNYQKPKANKTRTVSNASVGEDMAAVVGVYACGCIKGESEGESERARARVGRGSVEGRHDDWLSTIAR
jgi:hypothetical protein